ncbi:rCG47541 [Rattus norvegicus]|uniref:RCG47541 n=1 Tax=Rattus norvegicus TaxID=10116 RepID=A6HX17_RAT|nr:rCG47541 [Rattus norvegicus]
MAIISQLTLGYVEFVKHKQNREEQHPGRLAGRHPA